MALINCPECGQQVSDRARVCPHCGIDIAGEPKKRHHPVAVALVVALVVSLVVVLGGIYMMDRMDRQNETEAYERAIISGEPLILQDYLLRYPKASSEHRDSVEAVLSRLQQMEQDWQNALDSKSRARILRFIEQYPQSKHIKEGRLTIDSLDWAAACQKNSVEAYEDYLKEHANQGEHSDEAVMKRDEAKALLEAKEKALQDSVAAAAPEP